MTTVVVGLAYVLMFIGLVGAILPLIPGAPLIWLGAFLWAWAHEFSRVGWPTLLVLGLLTAASLGSDLAVTTTVSRRAGADWRAIAGAIVGGILGTLLLGGAIPILGAIPGAMAGAVIGIVAVEYHVKREWKAAWTAAAVYIGGVLISMVIQLAICLSMIGIFAWQAFF